MYECHHPIANRVISTSSKEEALFWAWLGYLVLERHNGVLIFVTARR